MPRISTPRMTRRMATSSTCQEYGKRVWILTPAGALLRCSLSRFRGARAVLALRWRAGARRYRWRIDPRIAWTRVEHLENPHQSALYFREPFFRIATQQCLDGSGFGFFEHRRRLFFDAAPHAGQREAVGKDQLLDAQDALDVGAPVNARPARRFRHTEIWKLRLPRSQARTAARWRFRTLPMP